MEQLEHPLIVVQLHQRRHRGMTKAGIGLAYNGSKLLTLDAVTHERRNNPLGKSRIVQRRHVRQLGTGEPRQGFRHVQAAIRRQAGQEHLFETQAWRRAPGADVTHQPSCPSSVSTRIRVTGATMTSSASSEATARSRFDWLAILVITTTGTCLVPPLAAF